MSLQDFLLSVPCIATRSILSAIAGACAETAGLARSGGAATVGSANAFGDTQLELDLAAEAAIVQALSQVPAVAIIASEENPEERVLHAKGTHSVAFDPLDGSSIVGCNWAVGSIFGVWRGALLDGAKAADVVAAAAAVYGPRTTLWVAAAGYPGTIELTLRDDGTWYVTDRCDAMRNDVRVFAPANLRAAQDEERYARLVGYYMKERYTLRYSGGLVPDVAQILTRRGGVFVSPVSLRAPAKLRVLYEVVPMAFLVENAGGEAVDHTGRRVLDRFVAGCDERVGLCVGSSQEVGRFVEMCCNDVEKIEGAEKV